MASNATFEAYVESLHQLNNSDDTLRTVPSVLLKSLALRIAVIIAYYHLGRLQGLSSKWSKTLPRMIILLILPGATLTTDLLRDYLATVIYSLRNRGWPWKWCMVSAAGLHVPSRAIRNPSIKRILSYAAMKMTLPYLSGILSFSALSGILITLGQGIDFDSALVMPLY